MSRIKSVLYIAILLINTLQGEVHIHEGLLTAVKAVEPLIGISQAPPKDLNEKIPLQAHNDSIWLPGYWAWEGSQYVWINGLWRKPPPEKSWTSGKWQQIDNQWVWLKGFWSDNLPFAFISDEPPDLKEDKIVKPDNTNSFWVPGHYVYQSNTYKWVKGYWESFDPNWVLVPAHYKWRPEGYVFIASYWDWPFSERTKMDTRSQQEIIQKAFYSYPDYLTFFAHYHHYQPKSLQNTPPWWSWQTWWTYNWSNQWALWWWYTHPGYVQPNWMTTTTSNHIVPPTRALQEAMKKVVPPLIVTANGVISNKKTIKEARRLGNGLILSHDELANFQNASSPKRKPHFKALVPNGKTNAMLLSREQFLQKSHEKSISKSPIKPYLKKIKTKLNHYQDIAVDNSTTETQRDWEEEIRNRDKKRSAVWEARKQNFNERSQNTVRDWDESVRERNLERGNYADETYRHDVKDFNKQRFWQPQIDAREQEYKEERRAIEEEKREHYLEEQNARKRLGEDLLSYSRDDARRDAMRSDTRRYMQNREDIRRDNLRYMQNRENIKRDNLRYQQKQYDLKEDRLQKDQRDEEKKKEDEKFWEEYHKLERERGDVSVSEEEKWWIDRDERRREEEKEDEEKFWQEQERQKEETRNRATDVQVDIRKFGPPLPDKKY